MENNMEYETKVLEVEIVKHNLQKMRLLNKIYTIAIITIVPIIYFLTFFPSLHIQKLFIESKVEYVLLLIFHLVIFYLFHFRKIHLNTLNNKKMKFFINFYISFSLILAALISIKDQSIYNPFLIYTLILFTCSSFLVLKAKQLLIPLIISSFILIIGLYVDNGELSDSYLQWVYIAILLPTAFYLSRSYYLSFEKIFIVNWKYWRKEIIPEV